MLNTQDSLAGPEFVSATRGMLAVVLVQFADELVAVARGVKKI